MAWSWGSEGNYVYLAKWLELTRLRKLNYTFKKEEMTCSMTVFMYFPAFNFKTQTCVMWDLRNRLIRHTGVQSLNAVRGNSPWMDWEALFVVGFCYMYCDMFTNSTVLEQCSNITHLELAYSCSVAILFFWINPVTHPKRGHFQSHMEGIRQCSE